MSAVDLLPCPFCGGEAKLSSRAASDGGFIAFAVCYCGAFSARAHHYGMGETAELAEAAAITAWNRRAPVRAGKVRKLEWTSCTFCRQDAASADTEFGPWMIVAYLGRGGRWAHCDPDGNDSEDDWDTRAECEAAAQADYEARILAALQPGDGWQEVSALIDILHCCDSEAGAIAARISGKLGQPCRHPDGVQVLEDAEWIIRAAAELLYGPEPTPPSALSQEGGSDGGYNWRPFRSPARVLPDRLRSRGAPMGL